jgi:hypothetical protein
MAELTHIEDGKAAVFKREGTYHARIRIDGKYVYRSLKTGDLNVALKAAQKLVHKFEFSVEHGIPIEEPRLNQPADPTQLHNPDQLRRVGSAHHLHGVNIARRYWVILRSRLTRNRRDSPFLQHPRCAT